MLVLPLWAVLAELFCAFVAVKDNSMTMSTIFQVASWSHSDEVGGGLPQAWDLSPALASDLGLAGHRFLGTGER
ncbi:hypothetical protein ABIE85_002517 [Bradyrhizobium diazoefficiens]|uniref:hypothetical protein n=1 Tax=Bradyrhizobium diazoefficiens TaxID=1355477 RepID=UPI00271528FE|nr:hypothetical protein [Bradyrhizobium diazoefficiens]WLA53292.1 hypothetical protein QIH81_22175 [Bradyrhizobium diazoefficiens]